jgi:hypothetical protein
VSKAKAAPYADEGLIGEYDSTGTEIKTYGWRPDSNM